MRKSESGSETFQRNVSMHLMKPFLCALLLLGLVACTEVPPPTPVSIPLASAPRSVIVDTDVSVDDILALLYLLSRPDVNVQAITISGTGITRCPAGIRNVRAILESVERTSIPIACGRETPMQGARAFPSEWRDAAENFFGVSLKPTQSVTPNEDATALLKRTLQASNEKMTVVTLGPMTNLADALAQDSALTQKIMRVYSMGGAVDIPGNVDGTANVEWNFYVDPVAAHQVFSTGVPVTLVPLDATNHVTIDSAFLDRFANSKQTSAAKLAEGTLQAQRSEIEHSKYHVWDLVAAVLFTDETLGAFEDRSVAVDMETGRTIQDTRANRIRVALKIDVPRFETVFLQTLNGQFK